MMFTTFIRRVFVVLLPAGATAGTHTVGLAPSASLYQSDVALTDRNGRVFRLADLRGEPVLASMFYALYQMIYPMIFETIRAILTKGGKPVHDGMRVLTVTVDPEHDSVTAPKKTASAHDVDDRWQVARADANGTREVAALLGVQYRRLTDGDFNHSSTILLLDAKGRINARTNTLGAVDPKLVGAMRKLVAAQC